MIHEGPKLCERTTIRLGGKALAEVRVAMREDFEKLPGALRKLGGDMRLLGEGSNIIAKDGELPIVIVTKAQVHAPHVTGEDEQYVYLRADAGMRLPALLAAASSLGLTGLEGLTGIPGSVGGAFAMNAGSYGTSFGERTHSVEIFSPHTGFAEKMATDFDFAYRSCALRGHGGWFLAASVTLALGRGDKGAIRAAMRDNYGKKQSTQPVTAKSAGCVFKNPAQGVSAGKLLDEAGLKGMSLGGMRFSPMHANFLINEGGGTYAAAEELLHTAREKVRQHSGHELELEVRIWP